MKKSRRRKFGSSSKRRLFDTFSAKIKRENIDEKRAREKCKGKIVDDSSVA